MKRCYELYFNAIIRISNYDLQSTLRGSTEGTHDNLEDEFYSCRKKDLKTLIWVIMSSTGQVLKDWRGRNIWIIKIEARWRSFILASRMNSASCIPIFTISWTHDARILHTLISVVCTFLFVVSPLLYEPFGIANLYFFLLKAFGDLTKVSTFDEIAMKGLP